MWRIPCNQYRLPLFCPGTCMHGTRKTSYSQAAYWHVIFKQTDTVMFAQHKHTPLHSLSVSFCSLLCTYLVFLNIINYRYSCTTLTEVATYTVVWLCLYENIKYVGLLFEPGPVLAFTKLRCIIKIRSKKHILDGSKVFNNGKH